MMTHTIIAMTIGAAIGFTGAYQFQQHRIDTMESENAKQVLANVQQSAAQTAQYQERVASSQVKAATRTVRIRSDSDASRLGLDRLRRAALYTTADADTTNPTAAGPERADPARELFLECGQSLQELAGRADRHSSDVQTLMDAWPSN